VRGQISLGARHEGNANSGPEGEAFFLGFAAPLSADGRRTEDQSIVVAADAASPPLHDRPVHHQRRRLSRRRRGRGN
jgi:hypothetical protein